MLACSGINKEIATGKRVAYLDPIQLDRGAHAATGEGVNAVEIHAALIGRQLRHDGFLLCEPGAGYRSAANQRSHGGNRRQRYKFHYKPYEVERDALVFLF
jgi:hypothetical protein